MILLWCLVLFLVRMSLMLLSNCAKYPNIPALSPSLVFSAECSFLFLRRNIAFTTWLVSLELSKRSSFTKCGAGRFCDIRGAGVLVGKDVDILLSISIDVWARKDEIGLLTFTDSERDGSKGCPVFSQLEKVRTWWVKNVFDGVALRPSSAIDKPLGSLWIVFNAAVK